MKLINSKEDLDKIVTLLEEYTSKSKKTYDLIQSIKNKKTNLMFVSSFILGIVVFILSFGLIYRLFYYDFFLFFGIFFIVILGIVAWYYLRFIFEIKASREDLYIITKQLKGVTTIASQFIEHNTMSEINNFEVKLRMIEAEELLSITKDDLYRFMRNSDFDKEFIINV